MMPPPITTMFLLPSAAIVADVMLLEESFKGKRFKQFKALEATI